ncbi:fimbrial protein [Pinirhizobacter sp.]|jgi:type 1 fimbria pilin|uniref:fimbrial protein n=1 Tax=Pinirhizobacter sp. TaxID=2950432 RepID=UPI002F421FE1
MSPKYPLIHRHRWKSLVAMSLAGWMLGVAKPALAACVYAAPATGGVPIANLISGNIMAGRDLPIGAVLGRSAGSSTVPSIQILCEAGTYQVRRLELTTPYPRSTFQPPAYRGNVFDTPIPGVGVAFVSASGIGFPGDSGVATYDKTTTIAFSGSWASYNISFIKTASVVGTGVIRAQDLPTFELVQSEGGRSLLQVFRTTVTGQVAVASRTCRTPDVTRDLGTHNLNELGNVGATTSWVDVPVQLLDCPAFFGSYQMTYNGDDGSSTLTQVRNVINYRVDPLTPAVDAPRGIMSLAPGGATGIGVQLSDSNEQPVSLSQVQPSNIASGLGENATYTLGFKARYIQTAANPTAGTANASATLTFVYL